MYVFLQLNDVGITGDVAISIFPSEALKEVNNDVRM